jgi:F0F1-type ATP synthase beta subunit
MENNKNMGTLIQAVGPVVDVRFDESAVPPLLVALKVTKQSGETLVLEVLQHIGDDTVRCIAMGATDGIQRGLHGRGYRQADSGSGRQGSLRTDVQRLRPAHR